MVSKMRCVVGWRGSPQTAVSADQLTWQEEADFRGPTGLYKMHEPLLDSFIADVKDSPEGRLRGWPFPNNDNYVWVHPNVAPRVAAHIREHCSAGIAQAALHRTCNSTQSTDNRPSTGGSVHSQVTRIGDAKQHRRQSTGGIAEMVQQKREMAQQRMRHRRQSVDNIPSTFDAACSATMNSLSKSTRQSTAQAKRVVAQQRLRHRRHSADSVYGAVDGAAADARGAIAGAAASASGAIGGSVENARGAIDGAIAGARGTVGGAVAGARSAVDGAVTSARGAVDGAMHV